MKKKLYFLMIICCMLPILCALPVAATDAPAITYPYTFTNIHFWDLEGFGTDSRGFEFRIRMQDLEKECTFQSKDDPNPIIKISEYHMQGADSKFKVYLEYEKIYYTSPYIRLQISGTDQNLSDYPDAPGESKTVFSLLLNEETQDAVLSGLDALAANVKTEADAEALLPLLVQLFSAPIDYPPAEESTPAWVIGISVGAWAAVAAVPTVALINRKRKRKKESASVS